MRNQEYLTLKERLEILFGIRGASGDRAVRKKELDALANRVTRLREEVEAASAKGHYAFKEGPLNATAYRCTWNIGRAHGNSLDAEETLTGIRVLRDGIYRARYVHRSTGTDAYGTLALDGARAPLEDRAMAMWNHDHSTQASMYFESNFLGPLFVGELITAGPNDGDLSFVQYGGVGSTGSLSIERIA